MLFPDTSGPAFRNMEISEEAEGPIDRRAARTRAALKRALVSLTHERGYDAITIADLCGTARVGRSTFYAHFADKDDLKRSGLQQLRHRLTAAQDEALARAEPFGFGALLFDHARNHRHLYLALAGGGGATVALEAIRAILVDLVRRELSELRFDQGNSRELATQFVVGAYMATLTWWLDHGARVPLEKVAAQCRRMAIDGAASLERAAQG